MKTIRRMFETLNQVERRMEEDAPFDKEILDYLRKEKPELYGEANDATITQMLRRTRRDDAYRLKLALDQAHYFSLDNKAKILVMLNDAPKDKDILQKVRLPFPTIYIDIEFTKEDGVKFTKPTDYKIAGLLITESKESYPVIDKEKKLIIPNYNYFFDLFYVIESRTERGFGYDIERVILPVNDEDVRTVPYKDNEGVEHELALKKHSKVIYDMHGNMHKFLREFLVNICLFINQPEIEFIPYTGTRAKIDKHDNVIKHPIPAYSCIKLTGELKRYVDVMSEQLENFHYSHRFWVRGTWRTYKNDRYKEKKGQIQWIKPFIKGEGILVSKEYLVSKDKLSDKDNTFYEDIEPLKKPLHSMSDNERNTMKARTKREQDKELQSSNDEGGKQNG